MNTNNDANPRLKIAGYEVIAVNSRTAQRRMPWRGRDSRKSSNGWRKSKRKRLRSTGTSTVLHGGFARTAQNQRHGSGASVRTRFTAVHRLARVRTAGGE